MPEINRLSGLQTVQAGDLLPVYSQNNGDARKMAISLLVEYLNTELTFPGSGGVAPFVTQRAAPSETGFSVAITDNSSNTHLILTPSVGYAAGTMVLPSVATAVDLQEVLFNTTQQIDVFTIDGNGAISVTGAPTALAAEDYFRLKYDAGTQTWFRVG